MVGVSASGRIGSFRRQMVSKTGPLGNVTTMAYDADDRQIATQDANGHVSSTVYDADRSHQALQSRS